MTREEAKELLPLIKAFAEGKTIEERDHHGDWKEAKNPILTDSLIYSCVEYRIKPEPKYRPFKSVEECWHEMQNHHPFGWIKRNGKYVNITLVSGESSYDDSFKSFTFADGEPFGIKEE